MEGFILVLLLLAIYLIPTLIAISREHHQTAAIFGLNLFLGWTFLGWVAAFVWSLTAIRA